MGKNQRLLGAGKWVGGKMVLEGQPATTNCTKVLNKTKQNRAKIALKQRKANSRQLSCCRARNKQKMQNRKQTQQKGNPPESGKGWPRGRPGRGWWRVKGLGVCPAGVSCKKLEANRETALKTLTHFQ